ncbi:diguanylate cyclase [Paenibacillus chondroitinus]|uniref:Diguanylate cyclase n=1 Tax=Paenibacillus chondroitinus TaxID=59842 RepID=A0ABU6DN52_9BACL|nr:MULTISPECIES: diguanylate cyclase [Paenibacillus]MCY9663131.1 diguanylate cyclase [Paenibacillus anseongense]MEB4799196.1 diguanylate cyclase [Paenibacillus chondroitinus]
MDFLSFTDLTLFLLLFALFVYVFASVTITILHKVYLTFHFCMMFWPICQFAIRTVDTPKVQLFYLKLSFIDMCLIAVGWLLFTIFLTGHARFLRKNMSILLFVPAILVAICVIVNPNGKFVLPLQDNYIHRAYGPIFWVLITVLIVYIIVSLYLMSQALISDKATRIKTQVKQVFKGITVMTLFVFLDIFFNVVLHLPLPAIPGLTSLGILLSAIFFVIAIHRDKAFDIVKIAHQDIIDTIDLGILVLNDNEVVVQINRTLLPHIDFRIGSRFDMANLLSKGQSKSNIHLFLQTYQTQPLKRTQIEIQFPNERYVNIQTAPIRVDSEMVGRVITFQDVSEFYRLIHETNSQNEILHERNQSLIIKQDELSLTNRKLEKMAITDGLTGIYNRRYLTQKLEYEVMNNIKHQIPFSVILLDIDYFKLINDSYGHLIGDQMILSTVAAIRQTLRQTDLLARYGGEEFMIYLPRTSQLQATFLAERVKSTVESNKMLVKNIPHSLSITISIGLLTINNFSMESLSSPHSYLNELLESVDKALYKAKEEGRNRIVSVVR